MLRTPILLLITLLLTSTRASGDTPRTIRLGGIFDLSSTAGALWGSSERDGAVLAIEEWEKENPAIKVELKIEDSQYSNVKSVSALHKLTAADGIRYVIGPTWEIFVATMPVCESKKIVCISPSCNTSAFDNPKLNWVFSAWFDDRDYSRVLAEEINRNGYKTIAVISSISPYYDGLVDTFLASLAAKPVAVLRLDPDTKDFRSIIGGIPRDAQALAVFLLGDGGAQAFYKQWAEIRRDRPDVFSDDAPRYFRPPIDFQALGFKVYYSAPELSGERLDDFKERFARRFGAEPSAPSASVSYDATRIMLDCAARFDPESEKVRDCIKSLSDYQGASGTISFSGSRAIKERKMRVFQWHGARELPR